MQIDLVRDGRAIWKYIGQRIRNYPIYVNEGPGEDEDPIALITLGFQLN